MSEVLILSGLPASGKTTIAKEWVAEDPDGRVRVNYDDLRLGMFGPDWVFNWGDERKMKANARRIAEAALKAGLSVVIDNTNITPKARDYWKEVARAFPAVVVEQEVDTDVAECVRRDRSRSGRARVGRAVIERMALDHGFIDWSLYPNDFVVVDVDGTLADCEHRKHHIAGRCNSGLNCPEIKTTLDEHGKKVCCYCGGKAFVPKDWPSFFTACDKDTPIQPIIELVRDLSRQFDILIVSGRAIDFCGRKTEDWLDQHLTGQIHGRYRPPYTHLFMRDSNDKRPDTETKQDILDLLPKERIRYVLDDRDAVVQMWRRNGLTCLQVANGDF